MTSSNLQWVLDYTRRWEERQREAEKAREREALRAAQWQKASRPERGRNKTIVATSKEQGKIQQ